MSKHRVGGSGKSALDEDRSGLSWLIWLLAGGMVLQPLSTDLYLPSLPHIATAFDATPVQAQQTLSIFMLGFAGVQLLSGPLSDRWGRRPVLFAGLLIFILASIACAVAPSLDALLVGRFAQAVGCCTLVVVSRAIVNDLHPGDGAFLMARVSSIYALGPVFGPLFGGYIQVVFGWRAAFVTLSLMGIALGGLLLFWLPETNRDRHIRTRAPGRLFSNYGGLVRSAIFWIYTLPGALSFASIFVFLSGGAFLFMSVFGVSTIYAGSFFALSASGFWLGTIVCRRWLQRNGIDRTMHLGANISLIACLMFPVSVVAGFPRWEIFLAAQYLVMFSHGVNFPCAQAAAVTPFPSSAGAAAALMGAIVMLVACLVGVVVGITYDGTPNPISVILGVIGVLTFAVNRGVGKFRKAAA